MNPVRAVIVSLGVYALTSCVHAASQCAPLDHHILSKHQAPLCLDGDYASSAPESLPFKHKIWSHEPFCVAGQTSMYCTHTTSNFRNGHGLSVIANSRAAKAISSAFISESSKARNVPEEALEVRSIPGKGKGLVTSSPIQKGDTILMDTPRIIASAQFPSRVTHAQGQSLFNTIVEQLPQPDRDLVLSLDKSLGGTDIENVMKTNAFACQLNDGNVGDGYMCLFPSVARINHACRPNAHARFIPRTLFMEVRAVRDIKAGEEINISYGKIELKHAERQKLYKDGWNFTCTCAMCTASTYEIAGSDQRRARFAKLLKKLENMTSATFDAQEVVAWEKEIMDISAREGLDSLLAGDYERMAYVHVGLGRIRDAKNWATKAKESLMEWTVVDGGPENEILRVEELLRELGGSA